MAPRRLHTLVLAALLSVAAGQNGTSSSTDEVEVQTFAVPTTLGSNHHLGCSAAIVGDVGFAGACDAASVSGLAAAGAVHALFVSTRSPVSMILPPRPTAGARFGTTLAAAARDGGGLERALPHYWCGRRGLAHPG